jgi:methylglutaconyl-CoA hydratase
MSKMMGYSRDENLADARQAARMLHALDTLPVPLIGRVHGAALGGGAGLKGHTRTAPKEYSCTYALAKKLSTSDIS